MGLSRTVSEILVDFFPPSLYFVPPLKRFLLELETGVGGQKTRVLGLPGRQRTLTISSAVWIHQRDRQTDGLTDRHRTTAKAALTHSVAR